jgi:uncharacterized membrane protein (DUF4010 family)
MGASRLIGVLLIVAGAIALAYGGFTYTKHTDAATVGPVTLSLQHRQTVSIPVWAGVAGIVIGGLMLALGERKT